MKKLLFIPLLFASFIMAYGQSADGTGGISNVENIKLPDSISLVRDTSVVSYKGITYHQERIEEFTELTFDTMYMIQYAIVTEVTSMPENSVALTFYTNQELMFMVISDKYYESYEEAKAIGEKVKADNIQFEYYMVKPCVLPKSSPIIAKKDEHQKGKYRIQYTWTATYPEKVLEDFTVELYQHGFRQVSVKTFSDKEEAINWLLGKGHKLEHFWIFTISQPEPLVDNSLPNLGEGGSPNIKDK